MLASCRVAAVLSPPSMPFTTRALLHHTASGLRPISRPVAWSGSLTRYASELRASAAQQPEAENSQWLARLAGRLERLTFFDGLYQLDLMQRDPGAGYAGFVKDAGRLDGLKACLGRLERDRELWRDLTAPAPEGAGLSQSHLLALVDRIHPWSQGVFQASTPAVPLWWQGQPGLVQAFAPAVHWVEDGLARMAATGRFPLQETRHRTGQHLLFRGTSSFQEVFPEGVPAETGSERYALALQSCAMHPLDSFAARKQGKRDHELVIDPAGVPVVNMNRLIDAGFGTLIWSEALLPIASSGLRIQDGPSRERELRALGIEAQGDPQMYASAFALPDTITAALRNELQASIGKGARPLAPPHWKALLDASPPVRTRGPQAQQGAAL
jgi:hypothetical protein